MSDMDELVEKAARAMSVAASKAIGDDVAWDSMPEPERNNCRALTRAALEAIGLPALLERVEAAEGARDALAQAIHDGRGILGFDNDGDDGPHTSDYIQYAAFWVNDAQELPNDHDEAGDEYDALAAKVAAVEALVDGPLTVDAHLRSSNGDLFISAEHLRAALTEDAS